MKRRLFISTIALVTAGAAVPLVAQARFGRPASPGSVAGVHRRHRRRRRRRVRRRVVIGTSLYSLPYGCSSELVTRDGVEYHYCNGIWYRPTYQGTDVVYVVQDIDKGADTTVEVDE